MDVHGAGDLLVTSTTAHELPYPTGSDAPCDFDDTWCDFTAALDAQMNEVDLDIKRYQPTISMAKLTRDTDQIFLTTDSFVFPIRFEAVELDTDDMADFAVSQFTILPRRLGTYFVSATVGVASGDVDNFEVVVTRGAVITSPFTATYNAVTTGTGTRGAPTDTFNLKASGIAAWQSTDVLGFGVLINPLDPGTFSMQFATLSVFWVSDVVAW